MGKLFVKYKEIDSYWDRKYIFISNLNVFTLLLSFSLAIVFFFIAYSNYVSSELFNIFLACAITFVILTYCLYMMGKYLFYQNWNKYFQNQFVKRSIENFGIYYKYNFILKYFSAILYDFFMIFSFIFLMLSLTLPIVYDENFIYKVLLTTFYLSWFFLIFIDYKNSTISSKELELKQKKVRFKFIKKFTAFFVFAIFWTFMPERQKFFLKFN